MSLVHSGRQYAALARCRVGTSAAEFALVLPLLLTLVLGTLQVGMLMYSYNLMVSSARDTARAMAVCSITSVADARAQVLRNLPAWVPAGSWSIVPVIASDVSVTIGVSAAQAAILNYIPFEIGSLTTKITMRREPLAFGGGSC